MIVDVLVVELGFKHIDYLAEVALVLSLDASILEDSVGRQYICLNVAAAAGGEDPGSDSGILLYVQNVWLLVQNFDWDSDGAAEERCRQSLKLVLFQFVNPRLEVASHI